MPDDPLHALASRLRALRKDAAITQRQLADVLSADGSTSVPLISSWESTTNPRVPPESRLGAYARFFATPRSVQGRRLLPDSELTDHERTHRDTLMRELITLRAAALGHTDGQPESHHPLADDFWRYPPGQDIRIVCAELPEKMRGPYGDPASPDYVRFYRFADPEALLELYGHIRAVNPTSSVHYRIATELRGSDYSNHLVLIGGVDWNNATEIILDQLDLPIQQLERDDAKSDHGGFQVGAQRFEPIIENGELISDVAHFYTGPNPFNGTRTLTICNGMFARGTLGAARALVDSKFRDRNRAYVQNRFAGVGAFSIITRVPIVNGLVVTPDWTAPHNRLHEWPEVRGGRGDDSD